MIRLEFVGGMIVYWDEKIETLEAAVQRAFEKRFDQRTKAELAPTLDAAEAEKLK